MNHDEILTAMMDAFKRKDKDEFLRLKEELHRTPENIEFNRKLKQRLLERQEQIKACLGDCGRCKLPECVRVLPKVHFPKGGIKSSVPEERYLIPEIGRMEKEASMKRSAQFAKANRELGVVFDDLRDFHKKVCQANDYIKAGGDRQKVHNYFENQYKLKSERNAIINETT